MVYLFNVLFVPLYYAFIRGAVGANKSRRKWFFIIVGLHAILFRAIANPFNYPDTLGYAMAFDEICGMSFKEAVLSPNRLTVWGQAYVALNWLVGFYTKDVNYLFITLSVLSVGGVVLYYYKSSRTPLLSILLYLLYPMMYVMGFGVVRQHLSIVFVLWALYYADKWKVSVCFAILAMLFHTSSILFLPFYIFRRINMRKINSVKLMSIVVVGPLLLSMAISYFMTFSERYEEAMNEEGNQSNIVPVIMIGSMVIMFMLTKAFQRIKDYRDYSIVCFFVYGLIIALFGMSIPRAGRLSLCFIYCMPVGISLLNKYIQKKERSLYYLYNSFVFLITFIMIIMSSAKYEKFVFIWERI